MENEKIIFIVIISVVIICIYISKNQEMYSPYRSQKNCFRTGYNYLDAYTQNDFYKKYPRIYPNPPNYYKQLYKHYQM